MGGAKLLLVLVDIVARTMKLRLQLSLVFTVPSSGFDPIRRQ